MKQYFKRVLVLLLTVSFVAGSSPFTALADEIYEPTEIGNDQSESVSNDFIQINNNGYENICKSYGIKEEVAISNDIGEGISDDNLGENDDKNTVLDEECFEDYLINAEGMDQTGNKVVAKTLISKWSVSFVIDSNGDLWGWGDGAYNGNGEGRSERKPVRVKYVHNVKQVSIGGSHVGAIDGQGTLWMWGDNRYGILGDGTNVDRYEPVAVLDNVREVSLGKEFSAAIDNDNNLYMWGRHEIFDGGSYAASENKPRKVMENIKIKTVRTNWRTQSVAVIDENGKLYVCGAFSLDAHYGDLSTPILEDKDIEDVCFDVSNIAALDKNGDLYIWGSQYGGSLGNGSKANKTQKEPFLVKQHIKSFKLANHHCGAIDENNTLWMWGLNNYGQVGCGSDESSIAEPVSIKDDVALLEMDQYVSAIVDKNGGLWMWGSNSSGQLGDGTKQNQNKPVQISGNYVSIQEGCLSATNGAVDAEGNVWRWGDNTNGLLGDGTSEERKTPVKIDIPPKEESSDSSTTVESVINGKGYAFYRMRVKDENSNPLVGKEIFYTLDNSSNVFTAISDEKGYVTLKTKEYINTTDTTENREITLYPFSNDKKVVLPYHSIVFQIEIKPVSYAQSFRGLITALGEIGAEAGISGEIGPIAAGLEGAHAKYARGRGTAIKFDSNVRGEDGKRKRSFVVTSEFIDKEQGGGAADPGVSATLGWEKTIKEIKKNKSKIKASGDLLGGDLKVLNLGGKATIASTIETSLSVDDIDSISSEELNKLAGFLGTSMMSSTHSEYLNFILSFVINKLGLYTDGWSVGNSFEAEGDFNFLDYEFGYLNNSKTGTVAGLGSAYGTSAKHTQYKDGTSEESAQIVFDTGVRTSLGDVNSTPYKNNVSIKASNDSSGNVKGFSIEGSVSEDTGVKYAEPTYIEYQKYKFDESEANTIVSNNSNCKLLSMGMLPLYAKDQIDSMASEMFSGRYSPSMLGEMKARSIYSAPATVGGSLGAHLKVGADFEGLLEYSYGISENKIYSVSGNSFMEANGEGYGSISDPKDMVEDKAPIFVTVVDKAFKVIDKYIGMCVMSSVITLIPGGGTVVKGMENISLISHTLNEYKITVTRPDVPQSVVDENKNIEIVSDDYLGATVFSKANVIGVPYMITIEDISGERVTDLNDGYITMRLDYSSEDLENLGLDDSQAKFLKVYRFNDEANSYKCIGGVANETEKYIEVDIEKSGEYLLGMDTTAPGVTNIVLSDYSSTPTITALVMDESGIDEISLRIDDKKYLSKENYASYYNESTGKLTFSAPEPLSDGLHTIYISAIDSTGNGMSEEVTKDFYVGKKIDVSGISLSTDMLKIKVGEEKTIKASVKPSNAFNSSLIWESDDTSIVSVNTEGAVFGESHGQATITVRTADGDYRAKCLIIVSDDSSEEDDSQKPIESYEGIQSGDLPTGAEVPDGIWIGGLKKSYPYTGNAIKPEVRVYYKDKRLSEGVDYTLGYKKNTAVGTSAYVTVKCKGDFKGSKTVNFSIEKNPLTGVSYEENNLTVAKNGKKHNNVKPVLMMDGVKLKYSKNDFELKYLDSAGQDSDCKEAGAYTIRMTAKSSSKGYSGYIDVPLTVTDKTAMGGVTVTASKKSLPYTGEKQMPTFTLKYNKQPLTAGTYSMVELDGDDYTTPGNHTVIFKGNGTDVIGSRRFTYKITGKRALGNNKFTVASIASAYLDPDGKVPYANGGAKPKVLISYNGIRLKEGRDYTLSYKVFFASPFWKKLQSKNGQPCMSKKDKVARIPGTHGAGMNPLQTGYLYQR